MIGEFFFLFRALHIKFLQFHLLIASNWIFANNFRKFSHHLVAPFYLCIPEWIYERYTSQDQILLCFSNGFASGTSVRRCFCRYHHRHHRRPIQNAQWTKNGDVMPNALQNRIHIDKNLIPIGNEPSQQLQTFYSIHFGDMQNYSLSSDIEIHIQIAIEKMEYMNKGHCWQQWNVKKKNDGLKLNPNKMQSKATTTKINKM